MMRLVLLLIAFTPLFSLEISTGYRKDMIHWSFQDPSLNLFKGTLTSQRTYNLEWVNLKQATVGGVARACPCDLLYKFSFDVSFVLSGHFKEKGLFAGYFGSPYAGARGNTSRIYFGFGYPLYFCDDDFEFVPLLGVVTDSFYLNAQKYVKSRGRFTGPSLGFEFSYCLGTSMRALGSFDYCFARFSGRSCKERDEDFAHFDQKAFGKGLLVTAGLEKSFWKVWSSGFKFTWTDWRTFKKGELYADVENQGSLFAKDTPMGPLRWNSFTLEGSLSRNF